MPEIDERSMGTAVAIPRYPADPTIYAPTLTTPHGFHIGRSLPGDEKLSGDASSPVVYSGALQLFLSYDATLRECESDIKGKCDRAQVHPGICHTDGKSVVGRGYWVRGSLDDLMALQPMIKDRCLIAPVLMDIVDADAYGTPGLHGRVIVPFQDGVIGTSILSADQVDELLDVLSDHDTRPVIQHLDFNGTHFGTTDVAKKINTTLANVRDMHATSDLHNQGMTTFETVGLINIESYPVRMF